MRAEIKPREAARMISDDADVASMPLASGEAKRIAALSGIGLIKRLSRHEQPPTIASALGVLPNKAVRKLQSVINEVDLTDPPANHTDRRYAAEIQEYDTGRPSPWGIVASWFKVSK